jgi:cytochrome c peroxidase
MRRPSDQVVAERRTPRRAAAWLGVLGTTLAVSLLAVPWQPSPAPVPLPAMPGPIGNPNTSAKVDLGRALFFDPVLSRDGTLACATCHDPAHGFADPRGFSRGIDGNELARDTPSVANLAATTALFRDGRAGSLEGQAIEPLLAPAEMAADATRLCDTLGANAAHRELFERAFGDAEVSLPRIARALAAYERTLIVRDTPYDRWAAGDRDAMSASAQRGFALFVGKADRAECHPAPWFG